MRNDYFSVKGVDFHELFSVLLDHFSQAEGVKFQRPGTHHFLDLLVDDMGNGERIQYSKGFPTKEREEIEKNIQNILLTRHETKVQRVFVYCDTQIKGCFRYKDLFQVLPMPDEAPEPSFSLSDHPFILEVSYESCPSWMVEASRKRAKVVLYTRLLNL